MELVDNKNVTLIGTLREMPISNERCLKIDVLRKNSTLRTIARLKPDYKFTTKTIGDDFYVWRIK